MSWQPPGSKVGLDLGALGAAPGTLPGSKVGLNLGASPAVQPFLDGLVAVVRSGWPTTSPRLLVSASAPWGQIDVLSESRAAHWQPGAAQFAVAAMPWAYMLAKSASAALWWQRSAAVIDYRRAEWAQLPEHAADAALPWSRSPHRQGESRLPFRSPPRRTAEPMTRWRTQLPTVIRHRSARWTDPPRVDRDWRAPWGEGELVPWIIVDVPPPPPPGVDGWQPPGNKVGLNLGCPIWLAGSHIPLNIGPATCYAVRPWAQRTYVVLNSVSVVRLPDLAEVRVTSLSIAAGVDSPFWSAQLTLEHPDDLALIRRTSTGRRQVRITVNGWQWVMVVEDYSHDRQHAAFGAQVVARSVTALHAPPYALATSAEFGAARTMAQLFGDVLAGTGITAIWDTVDWLVPAGAFSYRDLTPVAAAARIAEAAGAVLVSDRVEAYLFAQARYPTSPWAWQSTIPDVLIVDDLILSESVQESSAPIYEQVAVRGERQGVAATVRRTGSAGAVDAPQVVDALITHADGARERARNVLSTRGERAAVTYVLPLFAAGGAIELIEPLELAQIEESGGTWKGQVRGVTVAAQRDGAKLVVTQTVELERSYTDAG